MRFTENGPLIPDALLTAQERGEVLFLCGAGVSMPAGLPSFLRLAKLTADALSVPANNPDRIAVEQALADKAPAPQLDAVFERFYEIYGEHQVRSKVARLVRAPARADVSRHETILKLSRDASGRCRVLTTNFDPLFERAKKRLKIHVAPQLPRLDTHPLDGAVYLHGRAAGSGDGSPFLVLSQSDFGLAYMVQGWATDFMREALQRFTVVLLGYSAEDPPVNYLLRGLRSLDTVRPIYAFAEARSGDVRARWRQRNVEALPYDRIDDAHSGLWSTLAAWADRAVDIEAWRKRTIEMAVRGPRSLKAHERGQVVSLVRTEPGARALLAAGSSVPAEWLFVFDPAIRRAEPGQLGRDGDAPFDPRPLYGLDDDPDEPLKRDSRIPADHDVLAVLESDEARSAARLAGLWSDHASPLPARLHHLSGWIGANWASAHALWWAGGRAVLHPELRTRIELMARGDQNEALLERRAWALIDEVCLFPEDNITRDWYALAARIPRVGWTRANLRAFGRAIRPKLKMQRRYWRDFSQPATRLEDHVDIDIGWFRRGEKVPKAEGDAIAALVAETREALRIGASLLADLDPHEQTPTLHPQNAKGQGVISRSGQFFLFFDDLFKALIKHDPAAARREWLAWPDREPIFFDKLRLWVWTDKDLATADEVGAGIAALLDHSFWSINTQRELLWAMRARWSELTPADRETFEARVFKGRAKFEREDEATYRRTCAENALVRLGWLKKEGCALSASAETKLAALSKETGEDANQLSAGADHALRQVVVRWSTPNTNVGDVLDLPISEIVARCGEVEGERDIGSFEPRYPFRGLVQQRPVLALRVLSFEAKRGIHPERYWEELLQHWPDAMSARATWVVAQRLAALPVASVVALRHASAHWLKKRFKDIDAYRPGTALALWDRLFAAIADGGKKTESTVLSGAEDTFDKATNSPIGQLTDALLELLNAVKLKPGSAMPAAFAQRLEACLSVPEPGGAHAASYCGANFHWLANVAPDWAERILLPRFDLQHPHAIAIWDGFLYTDMAPAPAWFMRLKPAFLAAIRDAALWGGRHGARRLGQFLGAAALWAAPKQVLLSPQEARAALQTTTETVREAALEQLELIAAEKNGWRKYGSKFLDQIWPLELAVQTEATAKAWLRVIERAQGPFPEMAAALIASPVLVPVDDLDLFTWSMRGEDEKEGIAKLHPEAAVALLHAVVPRVGRRPYELDAVLDMIADAQPALRQDPRWLRLRLEKAA